MLALFIVLRSGTPGDDQPLPPVALDAAATIEQGRYLAIAGNCASCHTRPGGAPMAGGLSFETPFGRIHATNITPDPDTGLGAWSERDFLNAMRHGVRPSGAHLYPVFPFTAYTRLTDEDILAIFAYLRSLPPIASATPTNELRFPFDQRWLMAFWKTLFFEPGAMAVDETQPEEWNRGAYLVEALGHCSACHSPRNGLGVERAALAMSGGEYLDRVPEGGHRPWSAPNLTSSQRGLGLWPQAELVAYLHRARNSFLESFGPMNEVILNSTQHLRVADVEAMAAYLKSLPAIDAQSASAAAPDPQVLGRGRTVYNLHCGTCHLPTGEGDPEMAPRLNAGSLVVQSANPAAMINVILYGPEPPESRPGEAGAPWRNPMEAYQYQLDDEEVAAVATFVRHSWDNSAGIVTPEQVLRQR
ncbi:MAG: cytochrome c [Pseudomonadota bacterium]